MSVGPSDSAGSLAFSPPAITRMACEPDAMQAEARLLGALAGVTAFGYRFGCLVLHVGSGASPGVLVFELR